MVTCRVFEGGPHFSSSESRRRVITWRRHPEHEPGRRKVAAEIDDPLDALVEQRLATITAAAPRKRREARGSGLSDLGDRIFG